ncbi:MAG: proline--tRNA ligase [Clostridia bacterium]|jgi:prolyl-tRNA synthetase|nr:proline--tRNA ligase [Clostridia bacterium]
MYFSQLYAPTLRETPAEAEVISHKLLVRAGYIRKSSSGVYTYLPLAQRVLQKIANIVREEMNAAGGQEVMLPIIQPAELWLESGRWHVYGKELFRLKDRHERDFCLGPTHEEIITDLVRMDVTSYRQLPVLLYQIQNKYRDERRPRFGLMRGREFIMKDLYSFDKDEAGLEESYRKMYDAYTHVFTRCGLEFRPVEADSGAIGGSGTHEFMVIAQSGEAAIVYCPQCNYAANVEIAPCAPSDNIKEAPLALEKKPTPGQTTIEEVAAYLHVPAHKLIKTLFYETDDGVIAFLVRGDRTLNEIKANKIHPSLVFEMASSEQVKAVTGCEPGFVGPAGLQEKGVKVYADAEIETISNAVCGANERDFHYVHVQPGRDFTVTAYADLRFIEEGEPCPKCAARLNTARGIEVGQVFKLGTKYSKALQATYVDDQSQIQDIVMGCYGIGVSRTMAAAVEQNHDDDGIIWPVQIAPYQAVIIPVSIQEPVLWQAAEKLYRELTDLGVEVVLDDRDERAGVKFKDADLIGYPLRITVGKKYTSEKMFELKVRAQKEPSFIGEKEIAEIVVNYVR